MCIYIYVCVCVCIVALMGDFVVLAAKESDGYEFWELKEVYIGGG